MTIKKAVELVQDVQAKLKEVEHNVGTFKGIKNLSVSDLESVVLYANQYISSGGTGFNGLMQPMDKVKEVLDKCEIVEKNNFGW